MPPPTQNTPPLRLDYLPLRLDHSPLLHPQPLVWRRRPDAVDLHSRRTLRYLRIWCIAVQNRWKAESLSDSTTSDFIEWIAKCGVNLTTDQVTIDEEEAKELFASIKDVRAVGQRSMGNLWASIGRTTRQLVASMLAPYNSEILDSIAESFPLSSGQLLDDYKRELKNAESSMPSSFADLAQTPGLPSLFTEPVLSGLDAMILRSVGAYGESTSELLKTTLIYGLFRQLWQCDEFSITAYVCGYASSFLAQLILFRCFCGVC